MDPMAEKNYSFSPYSYCKNSPINRIDPDGMDDYLLMESGRVVLALITESNTDRLYATMQNSEGKINSIEVKDKGLLSGLSSEPATDYNGHYATTSNKDDAFGVFKFAVDNTNSEWSLTGYNNKNGMSYALNTDFDEGAVNRHQPGWYNSDMAFDIHSHPNKPGAEIASGYENYFNGISRTDRSSDADFMNARFNAAKTANNKWPNEYPKLYIYPKEFGKLYHYNHKQYSEYVGTVSTPQSMRSLVNKHKIKP